MKQRPQLNPKVWVLVNHNNKTIQFFLNEGQSFNGNGSYMSLDYFTHHYKKDMNIQGYSFINQEI